MAFAKRYARYLQQRLATYRQLAQDVNKQCKLQKPKPKEEESFHQHDLASEQFIRKLTAIQAQFDLLSGEFAPDALNRQLDQGLFERQLAVPRPLVQVLFRLFGDDLLHYAGRYEETMAELLEHFQLMSKKHCRETIELYRRMPAKIAGVHQQVQLLDEQLLQRNFGRKPQRPTARVPDAPLLEELELHLTNLESKPKRK